MKRVAAALCLASILIGRQGRADDSRPARSVYSIDPWIDGTLIGAGVLATAIPYAFAPQLITPRCPCDPSEVNAFDRHVIGNSSPFLDKTSDVTAGLAIAAPLALDLLDVGASKVFVEDAVVFSEVLALNGALVTLAKYTVQRPLPRVYAGQDPSLTHSPAGYRSFYSGHTAVTFAVLYATAYTLDLRHDQGAWPWVGATAIGVAVAAERVAAGRHFYTDVMVGAVAGSAFGILIPRLHERHEPGTSISVAPVAGGAMLTWSGKLQL
jgi:membrane-associated phospholipid phosphatase